MKTAEFSTMLRVYIEDTDAGGIVYYVNYLKFMERARTEFMRSLGFGKDYIFNLDLMFVVTQVAIRYHRPAQLDDMLEVGVKVTELRGATMIMAQEVHREGLLLAAADVTVACVDRAGITPRRLPTEMLESLRLAQGNGNAGEPHTWNHN
ncbi:tol-pal system-associated acyl-CoA thioesterase [Kineobactrum sediminis]|uniref:Tol-pal system-associated acyl-CoA thioesterase n=1 Tax=Kineobactrum sediminis TaxID=1905677 RepID=A0A2N5Y6M4_9GAMM|nr:tol-pal system-associated acyl-CoA thioesterase [Kineobactrum sediminis]PLW84048.1 tol-pal system-associated acyl-CoA thioesterase [Kineobactrum sediminis]